MKSAEIVVIGSDLNAFSLALEAKLKGYSVLMVRPTEHILSTRVNPPLLIPNLIEPTASGFTQSLTEFKELLILAKRCPDSIHTIRAHSVDKHNLYLSGFLKNFYVNKQKKNIADELKRSLDQNSIYLIDAQHIIDMHKKWLRNASVEQINSDIISSQKNTQYYEIKLFNREIIRTKCILNASGTHTLKHTENWFDIKSRCKLTPVWLHSIHFDAPLTPILLCQSKPKWFFLSDSLQAKLFYLSSYYQGDKQLLKTAYSTIQKQGISLPAEDTLISQTTVPTLSKSSFSLFNSKPYLIDLVTARNALPIINILSTQTILFRKIAEQCIFNLQSVIPAKKMVSSKSCLLK